jgi:hypothetical protein
MQQRTQAQPTPPELSARKLVTSASAEKAPPTEPPKKSSLFKRLFG